MAKDLNVNDLRVDIVALHCDETVKSGTVDRSFRGLEG